ncbi:MAG: class I SAM-dependent methyltransferase [bacterium]|nr:class I SAM-dependent methyltransferase [bacterium]
MTPAKRSKGFFRPLSSDYYKSFRKYIIPVSIVLGVAGGLLWYIVGSLSWVILIPVTVAAFLFLLLEVIRQVSLITHNLYQSGIYQMQSIQAIYTMLDPKLPLPSMARWAGNPDFCQLLMKQILIAHPRIVFELGSGVSTVVAGLTLKKTGGRILSLEHDLKFRTETQVELANHGILELASIYHSPLKEVATDSGSFRWYDLSVLDEIPPIDLLVIDGPPTTIQPLSRYPALPLLYDRLSPEAVIFLDDGKRGDEKRIVTMWLEMFDDLEAKYVETEKGAYLITRQGDRPT